jgi:hypothetical protein
VTGWDDHLADFYGIDPEDVVLRPLEDFLEEIDPVGGILPISATERTMRTQGIRAAAMKAGIDPSHPRLLAAIKRGLDKAPFTRYSGD